MIKNMLSIPKNIWSALINSISAINTLAETSFIRATTERLLLQREIDKLNEDEKSILIEELKTRRAESVVILKKAITTPILILFSIVIIIIFGYLFLDLASWVINYFLKE